MLVEFILLSNHSNPATLYVCIYTINYMYILYTITLFCLFDFLTLGFITNKIINYLLYNFVRKKINTKLILLLSKDAVYRLNVTKT